MTIRSTTFKLSDLVLAVASCLTTLCLMTTLGQTAVAQTASSTESASTAQATSQSSETATSETAASEAAASETATSEKASAEAAPAEGTEVAKPANPCGGGFIKDDGSVETGYGYVPNSTLGRYVQEIHSDDLPSTTITEVCVCWLRSRADSDLDFEVVFYEDLNGRPAVEPYAKVAATATEVPNGVAAAGRFYPVAVSGVTVPKGKSYFGVHWDPSASKFFYICVDQSTKTKRVNVFSMEDYSPTWTEVGDSQDPIFEDHRAILVRAVAAPAAPQEGAPPTP